MASVAGMRLSGRGSRSSACRRRFDRDQAHHVVAMHPSIHHPSSALRLWGGEGVEIGVSTIGCGRLRSFEIRRIRKRTTAQNEL